MYTIKYKLINSSSAGMEFYIPGGEGGQAWIPSPTSSESGPDTSILVAIQHLHIISTEMFEMLNVGVFAFECN